MFQRDYFMRMINQMTEALGQVMGLRKQMKQEEALLVLDELLDKHFRLSSKLIRSLSDEDLMKMMTTNGIVDTNQLQAIAILMKQEALLHGELGRETEFYAMCVRSLRLFIRLSLMKAEPTIVEPDGEIEELLELTRSYELPVPAKRLLMAWYESKGRYDQLENVMFELVEARALPAADAALVYDRLLALDDEELAAGGLPRDEIRQGLEELGLSGEDNRTKE
ncbi:hypothetical protein D3P08_19405 [Paenibacillus nanensis]|uniref:Uncharacterized protein n=1 Tax=Paenibacillus nanensis TaxID=393251 RepID=A0A3A1UTW5_9BACL|nr:DUF6483 family protein [Paenibacillus nanensis]RIX50861.1 hypothetical protein D3P08_19405 [Paenibacillus nanensis]